MKWIIEGTLAISPRPGYSPGLEMNVSARVVDLWIESLKERGIRSIICLLGEDQLPLYRSALTDGLIGYYIEKGFYVEHIPTNDGLTKPYTLQQLDEAWAAFRRLPLPVLVHCSAGHDRTGRVVEVILERLSEIEN